MTQSLIDGDWRKLLVDDNVSEEPKHQVIDAKRRQLQELKTRPEAPVQVRRLIIAACDGLERLKGHVGAEEFYVYYGRLTDLLRVIGKELEVSGIAVD
ncbi:hypothetical protein HCH_03431 [Hahella chejuensis KCTC 2396]|uniref:Uncharacterized protein n=1 Tax=Hahella chejuensis (strain KCTC 2396) TaxID=349521 RepID=Q2SGP5_HAHCH|nr:hypothetical protein [Hahella chejuensis]ABC30179.1 hypothetical protein HCH_03431 [Hahella chejuensis KCTC 2396]